MVPSVRWKSEDSDYAMELVKLQCFSSPVEGINSVLWPNRIPNENVLLTKALLSPMLQITYMLKIHSKSAKWSFVVHMLPLHLPFYLQCQLERTPKRYPGQPWLAVPPSSQHVLAGCSILHSRLGESNSVRKWPPCDVDSATGLMDAS